MKRKEVYKNEKGQLHRTDGPAYINDKRNVWYFNGDYHRVDGPAIIDNKNQLWYFNGKCHRVDGPAYIDSKHEAWWINHKRIMKPEEYIHENIKDFIYET